MVYYLRFGFDFMGVTMKSVETNRSKAWYYYRPNEETLLWDKCLSHIMHRTLSYTRDTNADDSNSTNALDIQK